MTFAFYRRFFPPSDPRLDQILAAVTASERLLLTLHQKVDSLMATLADIQTAESEESSAIDNVLAEIAQLQGDLQSAQSAGADQATIQAIVDKIHANTARLTAALPPSTSGTASGATGSSSTGSTVSGSAGAGGDTATGSAGA